MRRLFVRAVLLMFLLTLQRLISFAAYIKTLQQSKKFSIRHPMKVTYILIDDADPRHRELSICRSGTINRVLLEDYGYKVYSSIAVDAHNYAALFHYGLADALSGLPFMSESGNGLDSWDEAFLHCSSLKTMLNIIAEERRKIDPENPETVLLGWQEEPPAAFLREIDPQRFLSFLNELSLFVRTTIKEDADLEFIL